MFNGCRTTMWSPRMVLPFLALMLIPAPGVSQFGAQLKRCSNCKTINNKEDPTMFQYAIDRKVKKYVKCPHQDIIRFELEKEILCAKTSLSWVIQLKDCIDKNNCLNDPSSSSQREFSKGTNEKPSTTTINVATTAPVTSMEPSTQSWDHNIGQSTKPTEHGVATSGVTLVAPGDLETTPLDSSEANFNNFKGIDKPSKPFNSEDHDSKMKHMRTAIISLITIILIIVAVGVGLYCHRKKTNAFSAPCSIGSIKYMTAPSQDSISEVKTEQ